MSRRNHKKSDFNSRENQNLQFPVIWPQPASTVQYGLLPRLWSFNLSFRFFIENSQEPKAISVQKELKLMCFITVSSSKICQDTKQYHS